MAINDQHVWIWQVVGGLPESDFTLETALGGVVFKQISQVVSRHNIAYSDDVYVPTEHALLADGAKNKASDASEPIDCNIYWHNSRRRWPYSFIKRCMLTAMPDASTLFVKPSLPDSSG